MPLQCPRVTRVAWRSYYPHCSDLFCLPSGSTLTTSSISPCCSKRVTIVMASSRLDGTSRSERLRTFMVMLYVSIGVMIHAYCANVYMFR
jgi:hypothetical protein